jgi:hypothetical protein
MRHWIPGPIRYVLKPVYCRLCDALPEHPRVAANTHDAEIAFRRGEWENKAGLATHFQDLMLAVAGQEDASMVQGRLIGDFGCGPLGSLAWASNADLRVGIDVLAGRYAEGLRPGTRPPWGSLPCNALGGPSRFRLSSSMYSSQSTPWITSTTFRSCVRKSSVSSNPAESTSGSLLRGEFEGARSRRIRDLGVDRLSYLHSLFWEVVQTKHFGQRLLGKSSLGPNNCGALRSFFSLGWIEENELLNLP